MNLKFFKSVYDKLGNDTIRSNVLQVSELVGMRKNVVRLDTNNFCNIECIFCSNKRGGGISIFFHSKISRRLLIA